MPRTKLTDAVVRQAELPEGKSDVTIWDSEVTGFGLRIRPGQKTYILGFRPAGAGRSANMKRLKLGTTETLKTVADARALARIEVGKIAGGKDPAADRKASRLREKSKVSDLLDRYEKDLQRRQYVNSGWVMNGLRTKMAKHLNDDIAELTGAKLAAIAERLVKEGKLGAADDFRSRVRAFLSWCVAAARVLPSNPLIGFRKQRATRADRLTKERTGRALSDDELAKVWNAASADTAFGRLVRFLILTGCRRGEGAGLARAMVDRKRALISLPAAFVKQARGHWVPIAPGLESLLEKCPIDARSDYVFASPVTGGIMSGWRPMRDKLMKRAGVDFTLHDLRRTFRTGLSRLGLETEVAELAIGHARSELEQIYNRDDALVVLRDAFLKWDNHVTAVLAKADAERQAALGVFG